MIRHCTSGRWFTARHNVRQWKHLPISAHPSGTDRYSVAFFFVILFFNIAEIIFIKRSTTIQHIQFVYFMHTRFDGSFLRIIDFVDATRARITRTSVNIYRIIAKASVLGPMCEWICTSYISHNPAIHSRLWPDFYHE